MHVEKRRRVPLSDDAINVRLREIQGDKSTPFWVGVLWKYVDEDDANARWWYAEVPSLRGKTSKRFVTYLAELGPSGPCQLASAVKVRLPPAPSAGVVVFSVRRCKDFVWEQLPGPRPSSPKPTKSPSPPRPSVVFSSRVLTSSSASKVKQKQQRRRKFDPDFISGPAAAAGRRGTQAAINELAHALHDTTDDDSSDDTPTISDEKPQRRHHQPPDDAWSTIAFLPNLHPTELLERARVNANVVVNLPSLDGRTLSRNASSKAIDGPVPSWVLDWVAESDSAKACTSRARTIRRAAKRSGASAPAKSTKEQKSAKPASGTPVGMRADSAPVRSLLLDERQGRNDILTSEQADFSFLLRRISELKREAAKARPHVATQSAPGAPRQATMTVRRRGGRRSNAGAARAAASSDSSNHHSRSDSSRKQNANAGGDEKYSSIPLDEFKKQDIDDALQDFQCGHRTAPAMAAMKGAVLRKMQVHSRYRVHALTMKGVTHAVRRRHRKALEWMTTVPDELLELPLDIAILEMVERRRIEHKWSWSTTDREFGNLLGALMRTSMYTTLPFDLRPKESSHMRDAGEHCRRMRNETPPKFPKAITQDQVMNICKRLERENNDIRFAIMIAWATANRPADVLRLKRQEIVINDKSEMSVMFCRGKTSKLNQPFTVHTHAGVFATQITSWLSTKRPNDFVYDLPTTAAYAKKAKDLLTALRTEDSALEQKSLRRGALQYLASIGADEETLLHFSTHSEKKMLRYYLNHGMQSLGVARVTRPLGQQLCIPRIELLQASPSQTA
jgi:hypothetical protein